MHRHLRRLVQPIQLIAITAALAALVAAPNNALAASEVYFHLTQYRSNGTIENHTDLYGDSNNVYTDAWGYLHGIDDVGNRVTGRAEEIAWTPDNIYWIQANTHANVWQPAIVFHIFDHTTGGCPYGNWVAHWTNLPGPLYYREWGGCPGTGLHEVRISVGTPWELRAYDYEGYERNYTATSTWNDVSLNYAHAFTVDNYWWNPGTYDTVRRDYMTKFCFRANGGVYSPGGTYYTCDY